MFWPGPLSVYTSYLPLGGQLSPQLPGTFPSLVLKVLCPRNAWSGHSSTNAHMSPLPPTSPCPSLPSHGPSGSSSMCQAEPPNLTSRTSLRCPLQCQFLDTVQKVQLPALLTWPCFCCWAHLSQPVHTSQSRSSVRAATVLFTPGSHTWTCPMNPRSLLPGLLAPFRILAHRTAALWFSGGGAALPPLRPLLSSQVLPALAGQPHPLTPSRAGPLPHPFLLGV